ncbi:MAG: hypothetical protein WC915_03500 [archaeon]|jgi:hypothetical protein
MAKSIEVHLGNVGYSRLALQTRKQAKQNPHVHFIGIDIHRAIFTRQKWRQIKADYYEGLKKLKDNSASRIVSEMSLGGYNKQGFLFTKQKKLNEYTSKVINLAYQKLKPNGQLQIVESWEVLNLILKTHNSPFKRENIKIDRLSDAESKSRTVWTNTLRRSNIHVFELTMIK